LLRSGIIEPEGIPGVLAMFSSDQNCLVLKVGAMDGARL
jgi:hypothetical protein